MNGEDLTRALSQYFLAVDLKEGGLPQWLYERIINFGVPCGICKFGVNEDNYAHLMFYIGKGKKPYLIKKQGEPVPVCHSCASSSHEVEKKFYFF